MRKRGRSLGFEERLIVVLLLILTATLTAVTVYTQMMTRRQQVEAAVENGVLTTDNYADRLEITLSQLDGLSAGFYSNPDIQQVFRKSSLEESDEVQIRTFLSSLIQGNAVVHLSDIFAEIYPSGTNLLVRDDGSYAAGSNVHLGFPKSVKTGELYAFGPHLSEDYGVAGARHDETVFTFQQEWYDASTGQPLACVAADVDVNELAEILFPDPEDVGFLSLRNDSAEGVILERNYSFMDQDVTYLTSRCRESGWGSMDGRPYAGIVFGREIRVSNLELFMVRLVSDGEIYRDTNRLLRRNLLWFLGAYLLCILAIVVGTRRITAPIRKLDESMQYLSAHRDLSYRVSPAIDYRWDDEMGRLIRQTDDMLATIETMFARQELMSRAQREAETRMLQAQINPHFLYNSLQSIAALALQNGQEEIFNYINLLGERMHYSMDLEKTTAELREEFRYVESYLILQNVRFGNPVRAEFSLSPEAEHVVVPRMILQPLAENAFKHGKLCRRTGTYLKLSAELKDGLLTLVMEDNGLGAAPKTIEELNRRFEDISSETTRGIGSHIGLVNVRQRLQLFFDDRTTMHMEEAPEGGVRIVITIRM